MVQPEGTVAAALLHQPIVNAHELGVVVILQNELARSQFRFLPQEDLCAEMPLKLFNGLADVRIEMDFRGQFCTTSAPRSQSFNLPHCEPAASGALCITHAQLRLGNSQQCPPMS